MDRKIVAWKMLYSVFIMRADLGRRDITNSTQGTACNNKEAYDAN
jgi:hypothetical protein